VRESRGDHRGILGAAFEEPPMLSAPLLDTRLDLPLVRRGKVRDVYDAGAGHLLIVATDRISAFDYVLGSGVPDKGRILTQISCFWFGLLADVVPNHLVSTDPADFPAEVRAHAGQLRGRTMLVRRTEPLPVECVARGYLSGSGWKDYQRTGAICGHSLPPGLVDSSRLPAPIFTPATKAESGHDENITEAQAASILGADLVARLRGLTLALYARGAAHAERAGLIVADTKFEFGRLRTPEFQRASSQGSAADSAPAGEIILIDEVLTPDSSRFWPAAQWAPGGAQPSFDKQFVRDHLEQIRWNKQPPVPSLPDEVVARTRGKYLEAYRLITGGDLA
jgi:phosphoribosylaminoimidazole-succinocarboxamide synthase